MATAELDDPGSLGRVITSAPGTWPNTGFDRIVEARDATPEERAVRRINAGLYALPAPEIFGFLSRLTAHNAQGELYLTDAVTDASRAGRSIRLAPLADPNEALGVNTRAELARIHRLLIDRHLNALMAAGVTILEPERTTIEPRVLVGQDTVVHPGAMLLGRTEVGAGCVLHQGAWIRDSRIGEGVTIEPYSVLDGADVGDGCRVGPFARLRPASRLLRKARVGNFVEVKSSVLGEGTKVGHLAYVGDATVGDGANLGAGVVTCNYDGVRKNRTEIGRGAFIGSDTMLVAPVRVGDGAMTAAGSVVTRNVPDGALAVGRARQKNLAGRSGGLRPRKEKEADVETHEELREEP
jgi:bifunctional UDP-N-acetylglucosamine pyrophosphorylase/glucosamine-1-phosphate N-acetyltransferase